MNQYSSAMNNPGFKFQQTYALLPDVFFTRVPPVRVKQPEMFILNHRLGESLGLELERGSSNDLASTFSGNALLNGCDPIAQAYAGHQFGVFTNLGDGRAVLLGEQETLDGGTFDIQLKGSGRNPYSRGGDGRAALGPMLREYLISEAMHGLGIETTRSLAVVTTGEDVYRETPLKGAILTRVASSHIRVGTFQYAAAHQNEPWIRALMDYTTERHYPGVGTSDNPALALLDAFMEKQIKLVVDWMRVGFIHGVMNTDNMALSGETIDYGPCAFMDAYDPATVFSSIDHAGRYAFSHQPVIAQWNIARFAETLLPLIDRDSDKALSMAGEVMSRADRFYQDEWLGMMRAKLGLRDIQSNDEVLIRDLLDWMKDAKADYTNAFIELMKGARPGSAECSQQAFEDWKRRWDERRLVDSADKQASEDLMQKHNPLVIPRNHQVEEALAAATDGDLDPLNQMLEVFENPYQDHESTKAYQEPGKGAYQTFCGT
jgi:serine/tyrosine/threonine adenylyltransferase